MAKVTAELTVPQPGGTAVSIRTKVLFFCLASVICAATAASADFTLVDKIPAPQPCEGMGICPVTGLAGTEEYLFATVVYNDTSYIYLIRPNDGEIMDMYKWDLLLGGLYQPSFEAAAYAEGMIYWVADAANSRFLSFQFDAGSVYPYSNISNDHVHIPNGLAWQDMGPMANSDALWVTDAESDSLYLLDELGYIHFAYPLTGITHGYGLTPTSVAVRGDNLFFSSLNFPDSLFETTRTAERVEAHYLSGIGEMQVYGITFFGDRLYVAGYSDSILVYSVDSYVDPVPTGDSVIVEVIPNELDIGFAHVGEAGSLFVDVSTTQACPAPEGVEFFGDFYDVSTSASFDYLSQVTLTNVGEFPSGVKPKDVRVFVRPSGECTIWRDITVEIIDTEDLRNPILERLGKRLSEDDEFSVFTFAVDRRRTNDVVDLKFDYLDSAVTQNHSWIPPEEYTRMTTLLHAARIAYHLKRYRLAAIGADRIADVARTTPAIPHTYDPEAAPGGNVAGRIMSRAHTLSFSLRMLLDERQAVAPMAAWKGPDIDILEETPAVTVRTPNPSASEFHISFTASGTGPVSVKVYSIEGRLIRTLAEGEPLTGSSGVTWDGRNDSGARVGAGTYFAVIRDGEHATTHKLILQR
jgi:hypothetical protein